VLFRSITIDSTAVVKTDSISTIKNNISIVENTEELEICPLVDSLPIVVNGVTYKNVVLRYKKHNKVLVDTSSKIVSKNVLKRVSKHKLETKNTKEKTIDKKAGVSVYWGWLLIIIILILIFYLKEKLIKFLP
jgi:ATP-dependent Zn protease